MELASPKGLVTLHLGGNGLVGCVSPELAEVESNDLDDLGLPPCAGPFPPFQPLDSCSNGIVVPNPAGNPGLVEDCETLWAAKDTLAGDVPLDWSLDRAIGHWDGVIVTGNPMRVRELGRFYNVRLAGKIPATLSNLQELRALRIVER